MKTFYRIRLSHFGLHRLDEDLLSYSVTHFGLHRLDEDLLPYSEILFWSSLTG
ncbi:hypothetical protein ACQKMN_16160 [Ureibacillus composti]